MSGGEGIERAREIAASYWDRFDSQAHRDYAHAIRRGRKDDCEGVQIALLAAPNPPAAASEVVTQADRDLEAWFARRMGDSWIGQIAPMLARHRLATPTATHNAEALVDAGWAIIDRMFGTYKARNGREVGIQGDDGEKCWIVHSDDIEQLRRSLPARSALDSAEVKS